MSDNIMAYGLQNFPLCISDRVVSAIESQIISVEIVPYMKYLVMIPSFVCILSLVVMLHSIVILTASYRPIRLQ